MTVDELTREILAPINFNEAFARMVNLGRYKPVDVFHFEHCGCDECGAHRRVGIG
jgi:hypothetical protein